MLKGDLSSCLKAYKYQYIPANTVILERSTASVLTMLLQNIYLSYLKWFNLHTEVSLIIITHI